MSFANDVLTMLDEADIVTPGEDGFADADADVDGERIITIVETVGRLGARTHDIAGEAYESPTCQLVARAAASTTAEALIREAYRYLSKVRHRLVGEWRYVSLRPEQPPFALPRDSKKRARWAFNLSGMRGV